MWTKIGTVLAANVFPQKGGVPVPELVATELLTPGVTTVGDVVTWNDSTTISRSDTVAVEEPLEIRLAGLSVAVTMRTPGHDFDLAAGFLYTEGIIRQLKDIRTIAHCPVDDDDAAGNIVNVNVTDPSLVKPDRWKRNFFATSSCGICGKASIAEICRTTLPLGHHKPVPASLLEGLNAAMRQVQDGFEQTGGTHAAALFDLNGNLITIREDVGRHNAVDKVIGHNFRNGRVPLHESILVVSSRASFEIIQKALVAGIPTVAAVSAPSSLAVDLARDTGMTLVGFLRESRFNVYAGDVDG
ncbi:MAG: formate dehydrogenase accessory sulfurtransferase FdhD [Chloroflexota bacterium]